MFPVLDWISRIGHSNWVQSPRQSRKWLFLGQGVAHRKKMPPGIKFCASLKMRGEQELCWIVLVAFRDEGLGRGTDCWYERFSCDEKCVRDQKGKPSSRGQTIRHCDSPVWAATYTDLPFREVRGDGWWVGEGKRDYDYSIGYAWVMVVLSLLEMGNEEELTKIILFLWSS